MLAAKLHAEKKPFLGKGSYLIPITTWAVGKVQIRFWLKLLNEEKSGGYADRMRYISLVKLPDDQLVSFHPDWVQSRMGAFHYVRLCDVPPGNRAKVMAWWDDTRFQQAGPLYGTPEIALGSPLPRTAVKWTKDLRLLYRTAPARKPRRGANRPQS